MAKQYVCVINETDEKVMSGPNDPCPGWVVEIDMDNPSNAGINRAKQFFKDQNKTESWDDFPMYRPMDEQDYRKSGSSAMGGSSVDQMIQTTAAYYANYPNEVLATPDHTKLAKLLDKAGFKNDGSPDGVSREFGYALKAISGWGIRTDPLQALALLGNYRELAGLNKGTGSGGTTRSVQLTNEFDAEALVNGALNTYLGRDATEDEIDRFYKKLNASERANPTVTTRTKGGSTTTGGFNSQLAAEKFAEQQDDYADVQAQTTFKDLMEQAIRSRLQGDML